MVYKEHGIIIGISEFQSVKLYLYRSFHAACATQSAEQNYTECV